MADVRNKFFVVDNYTEGDNIVFFFLVVVYSAKVDVARC